MTHTRAVVLYPNVHVPIHLLGRDPHCGLVTGFAHLLALAHGQVQ
nr:hypothetical protein [Hymenobacter sp. BT188]